MKPKIYTSQDHHIRNDLIDPHALTVLEKLHEAGHTAYLVGGGVRDLLMRKRPKDFDIATSALPEEVKPLFRRCLLIGRRFRLAHVRFGRQVIEVATFRAGDPEDAELIVRDNVWGTPEEDVLRRDFTINGLFYDPADHRIIDYVGGFEDLQAHLLRSIGDPEVRFRQDPVRMLRMQKFQARFGFHVEESAERALEVCRAEISKSAPARILEEMFRMLESGKSAPFFHLLFESQLLEELFPELARYFANQEMAERLSTYLEAADTLNEGSHTRTLDRAVLTAALLFPILEYHIEQIWLKEEKKPHIGEIMDLSHQLIEGLLLGAFAHFPRRIREQTHFILHTQFRLTPFDHRKRPKIVRQRGFVLPLTFLKLRTLVHPGLQKEYAHWKELWKAEQ